MASPEHKKTKQEYNIKDLYYDLAKLQKDGYFMGVDIEKFIEDLDQNDMNLYQALKKLKEFDSSTPELRGRTNMWQRVQSEPVNIKDVLKERKASLSKGSNSSQRIFYDYISHQVDEIYGFGNDLPKVKEESKKPEGNGPTEL